MSAVESLSGVPALAWPLMVLGLVAVGLVVKTTWREAKAVRQERHADKEPLLGLGSARPALAHSLAEAELSSAALNEQFSCFIGRRNLDAPPDSHASLCLQGMPRRVGSKPVARVVSPSGDLLGLAVLLNVRQRGTFSEPDHQALLELIEAMVDAQGRPIFFSAPEYPVLREASEAAGEMLSALDARLVVYARLGEATPAALGVAMAELHLTALPDKPNQHVARDNHGRLQFLLAPATQVGSVVLVMDVPRVANPEASLGRLFSTATFLTQRFGGDVQDEAGRSLGEAEMGLIRQGLLARAEALAGAGLPPGGEAALWVFQ